VPRADGSRSSGFPASDARSLSYTLDAGADALPLEGMTGNGDSGSPLRV
jgi:hypothetical protein